MNLGIPLQNSIRMVYRGHSMSHVLPTAPARTGTRRRHPREATAISKQSDLLVLLEGGTDRCRVRSGKRQVGLVIAH